MKNFLKCFSFPEASLRRHHSLGILFPSQITGHSPTSPSTSQSLVFPLSVFCIMDSLFLLSQEPQAQPGDACAYPTWSAQKPFFHKALLFAETLSQARC